MRNHGRRDGKGPRLQFRGQMLNIKNYIFLPTAFGMVRSMVRPIPWNAVIDKKLLHTSSHFMSYALRYCVSYIPTPVVNVEVNARSLSQKCLMCLIKPLERVDAIQASVSQEYLGPFAISFQFLNRVKSGHGSNARMIKLELLCVKHGQGYPSQNICAPRIGPQIS